MSSSLLYRSKARITLGLLAVGAAAAFLSPANITAALAQTSRDVMNRLEQLENEVETLGRAVYRGEAPPPGALSGDSTAADTEVRLQELETQISTLTGKLEEHEYQIKQLQDNLQRALSDIDLRLQEQQAAPNTLPQPETGGFNTINNAPPVLPSDMPDAPETSGYQWNSNDGAVPPPPAATTSGNLGTLTSSGTKASSPAVMYEAAFAALKQGDYASSEQQFKAFVEQYPQDALAGNAKYWLGETYYARGDYEQAARTFAEAYQQYPKTTKAPDNLLKLGLALAAMNKKSDACVALGQIERQYAAAAGPVLRRSKQEMDRLGC